MSTLSWYCKWAVRTLRYEGLHLLLWRFLKLCLLPLGNLGFAVFYQKDLTKPIQEIRAKVDLTVGPATKSEIDQLTWLVALRYGPVKNLEWYSRLGIRETILERFRKGQKCFVGRIGAEIVHYNWIFFNLEESVPRTGCFIRLKEEEALMNDAFTIEALRGKNVHGAVHSQMLLFLQRAGYRRAYTIVSSNKSSRKTLGRVIWEPLGIMLYFIPRGAKRAWIGRIKGTLKPFANRQDPDQEGVIGNL